MIYIKWIVAVFLGCMISFVSLATVKPIWQMKITPISFFPADIPVKLVPEVFENTVYLASPQGTVSAHRADTGKVMWRYKTKLKLTAGPYFHNDVVYLGSQEGKLVALTAKQEPKILWETTLASEILAAPTTNDQFVFVNTMDGRFYALEASTGHIVWSFDRNVPQLILRQGSAPIVQNNIVLSGFASGKLLAFDAQSGSVIWEKAIAIPKGHSELDRMVDVSADLLSDGEVVFASAFQGQTVGVNIRTGMTLWERDISTQHNMALEDGVLYITDNKNVIWAVESRTGATLWKQTDFQKYDLTGPAIVKDKILLGTLDSNLLVLDKKNGNLSKKYQFKGLQFSQPPKAGQEMVYLGAKNGKLSAFSDF